MHKVLNIFVSYSYFQTDYQTLADVSEMYIEIYVNVGYKPNLVFGVFHFISFELAVRGENISGVKLVPVT